MESQAEAAREGFELMPEQGCAPVNRYLPPRPKAVTSGETGVAALSPVAGNDGSAGLLARWVDRLLSR